MENILLSNTPLLSFLENDVLQLASTSKATFHHSFEFINKNIQFRYPGDDQSFEWYSPQKLRIGGCFGGIPVSKKKLFDYGNYMQVILPSSHYSLDWNKLPLMLTHLTFGPQFNSPVDNILPLSLSHLIFGGDFSRSLFNHPVDHLPPSLSLLSLSDNFNQPIDNLPSSLSHLSLRSSFTQSTNNLPSSLTYLSCSPLHQPVMSLPSSLTHLQVPNLDLTSFSIASLSKLISFSCDFEIPSNTIFPTSVQELSITNNLDSYPPNLKHLSVFNSTSIQLPPSLSSLTLTYNGDEIVELAQYPNLKLLSITASSLQLPLPSSLVEINCNLKFISFELIQHLFSFPNLTNLSIISENPPMVWSSTPLSLPPKLTHLNLCHFSDNSTALNFINLIDFNSSPLVSLAIHLEKYAELSCEYPPSLTTLDTSVIFKGQLPQSLQRLSLTIQKKNSSYILPQLPENLTHLNVANCSPPSTFPPKLKSLDMSNFTGDLPPLPETLQRLILSTNECQLPILPHSLKKLVAPGNSISCDTFIPPSLEYMNISTSKTLPKFPVTLEDCTFARLW